MKRLFILALLAPLLLLTGCNKATQDARERGKERRLVLQQAHQLEMQQREIEARIKLADKQMWADYRKQEQFLAFIGPFGRFVIVVVVAGGLVYGFRVLHFAAVQNEKNRQHDLDKFREAEITARTKCKLAYDRCLTPEFFAQLSDEHRSQIIAKLEGPPPEVQPEPPRAPLHERMYDDAKGAWGRFWNRRAA